MPDLEETITGYVAGDNLEFQIAVTNLDGAMVKAWLTVKRHQQEADSAAQFQKIITTSDAPGTGQITDAGGAGEDGALRFDLTAEDTAGLGAQPWVYDIQIKLTSGEIYTVEKGTMTFTMDVTKATT